MSVLPKRNLIVESPFLSLQVKVAFTFTYLYVGGVVEDYDTKSRMFTWYFEIRNKLPEEVENLRKIATHTARMANDQYHVSSAFGLR